MQGGNCKEISGPKTSKKTKTQSLHSRNQLSSGPKVMSFVAVHTVSADSTLPLFKWLSDFTVKHKSPPNLRWRAMHNRHASLQQSPPWYWSKSFQRLQTTLLILAFVVCTFRKSFQWNALLAGPVLEERGGVSLLFHSKSKTRITSHLDPFTRDYFVPPATENWQHLPWKSYWSWNIYYVRM